MESTGKYFIWIAMILSIAASVYSPFARWSMNLKDLFKFLFSGIFYALPKYEFQN
jgi:hypothetical protein